MMMCRGGKFRRYVWAAGRLSLRIILSTVASSFQGQNTSMIAHFVATFLILKDNLPANQTWQWNLLSLHVIIKYQQKSQMK